MTEKLSRYKSKNQINVTEKLESCIFFNYKFKYTDI